MPKISHENPIGDKLLSPAGQNTSSTTGSSSHSHDMTTLPPEILYPILKRYILFPSTSPHAAVSLRLISRSVNDEILHLLFTLGLLDSKYLPKNACYSPPCQLLQRPTKRAERRGRAINTVTVMRYLSAWIQRKARRHDPRASCWGRLNRALEGLGIYRRATLSMIDGERQKLLNITQMCEAIITLLGMRDTWAYFGPEHDSCKPPYYQDHHRDEKPTDFWAFIVFANNGDLDTVRDFLEKSIWDTQLSSTGSQLDDKLGLVFKRPEWKQRFDYAAAALTIAVRKGYQNMIEYLLPLQRQKDAMFSFQNDPKLILCEIKFWDQRSVLDTLFATTAHQDETIAQVAIATTRRILNMWDHKQLKVEQHYWRMCAGSAAMGIPTSSGLLLDALKSVLPCTSRLESSDQMDLIRAGIYLLLQAALENSVMRATIALEIMPQNANAITQGNPWLSSASKYWLSQTARSDEYGVRPNSLFEVSNPIRIAAALSHLEILEWLLTTGWPSVSLMSPQEVRTMVNSIVPPGKDKIRVKGGRYHDHRQEAVHHVFIDQCLLPKSARSERPNIKALELIMKHSTDLDWAQETILSAGKCTVDIFTLIANHADLTKDVPAKTDKKKGNMYVKGARARTVGERSLQHALKASKFDNARLLLSMGVRLAEPIRTIGFFHDDPDAVDVMNKLRDQKLPGVSVVARCVQVLYWVEGDTPLTLRQTKAIEERDQQFVWKDGQKVQRIGSSTF